MAGIYSAKLILEASQSVSYFQSLCIVILLVDSYLVTIGLYPACEDFYFGGDLNIYCLCLATCTLIFTHFES